MTESKSPITIERADGVAWLTIDCPPMNLLGGALFGALAECADVLEADRESRVAVFRSADPEFFIAHGDVEVLRRRDVRSTGWCSLARPAFSRKPAS